MRHISVVNITDCHVASLLYWLTVLTGQWCIWRLETIRREPCVDHVNPTVGVSRLSLKNG